MCLLGRRRQHHLPPATMRPLPKILPHPSGMGPPRPKHTHRTGTPQNQQSDRRQSYTTLTIRQTNKTKLEFNIENVHGLQ